ncbi:MAG: HAD hydrolase family protein [Bacteroidota bacterium]
MEKPRKNNSIKTKVKKIKLLLLDVDGVLTDGRIVYTSDGTELKFFDAHDGYGFSKALKAGLLLGIISGRSSPMVTKRAKEFFIQEVHQDVENKILVYEMLKKKYTLADEHIAYVGDDIPDLGVLRAVGFSACPSDAMDEVKKNVDFIASREGGRGAVREVIDILLARKNK